MTEAHQIDRPLAVGSHEGLAGRRTERVGCCTLHLADYRDVLPTLQGVTAIVTDPPYGNDYRQKRSRDKLVKPDTTHAPIVGNAEPFDPRPLLQAAPVVVLWGANYYADKLPANGKWLVWDKREGTTPDDGADVELAWTNLRGVPRMHRQLWRGICRRGEENVSRGAKKLHPNQKPVALMDWCLQQAGVGADALVVDTHMGSGTTALACLRRGVRFVGMEIDPLHFATSVERLRKELLVRHEPANVRVQPRAAAWRLAREADDEPHCFAGQVPCRCPSAATRG